MGVDTILESARLRYAMMDNAELLMGRECVNDAFIEDVLLDARRLAEQLFRQFGVQMVLVDALDTYGKGEPVRTEIKIQQQSPGGRIVIQSHTGRRAKGEVV